MDRVNNYSMGKWTRSRDLEIFMEVSSGDVDFLIMIEGLERGVVGRGEKVGKELIYEFQAVWVGGKKVKEVWRK